MRVNVAFVLLAVIIGAAARELRQSGETKSIRCPASQHTRDCAVIDASSSVSGAVALNATGITYTGDFSGVFSCFHPPSVLPVENVGRTTPTALSTLSKTEPMQCVATAPLFCDETCCTIDAAGTSAKACFGNPSSTGTTTGTTPGVPANATKYIRCPGSPYMQTCALIEASAPSAGGPGVSGAVALNSSSVVVSGSYNTTYFGCFSPPQPGVPIAGIELGNGTVLFAASLNTMTDTMQCVATAAIACDDKCCSVGAAPTEKKACYAA
eukprot:scaffold3.g6557.t1